MEQALNPHRIEPGPGQESVWDYPRPPRVEATSRHLVVVCNGVTVAETRRALRVLETSQAPAYYFPPDDVDRARLVPGDGLSWCEWKGPASYYTLVVEGRQSPNAAWTYLAPTPAFAAIKDHVAFYPQRVDTCTVDGERVQSHPGNFYGGWVTSHVVGPFKGAPGTSHW